MDRISPITSDLEHPRPESPPIVGLFPADLFETDLESKRPPTVTISKSPEEVYAFLRDFNNYGRFMSGVLVVHDEGRRARWMAEASGTTREWATEIVREKPGRMLAWRTVEGGAFRQVGAFVVTKATGGRGTVVALKIESESLLGRLVDRVSKLALKDIDNQSYVSLRQLKALLETGEVPTTEGQPSGRDEDLNRDMH